jgi:hypothetical protein
MTTVANAYVSDRDSAIFYLAYDLMLARVPLREGMAVMDESSAVVIATEDPGPAARHEAIRAALLEVLFAGDDGSAHVVEEARAQAAELAARAGLDGPPPIDRECIRLLELGGDTRVEGA